MKRNESPIVFIVCMSLLILPSFLNDCEKILANFILMTGPRFSMHNFKKSYRSNYIMLNVVKVLRKKKITNQDNILFSLLNHRQWLECERGSEVSCQFIHVKSWVNLSLLKWQKYFSKRKLLWYHTIWFSRTVCSFNLLWFDL